MEKSVRVLMVDDEPDFLEPVSFWLQSKGYKVITASNGHEAIQKIKQDVPDIVFLDIHMPGIDGIETLRQIRQMHADLPVIIVTAVYQDAKNLDSAMKLGVSGFFPKQTKLSELVKIIEASLRAHAKLKSPPIPPSE